MSDFQKRINDLNKVLSKEFLMDELLIKENSILELSKRLKCSRKFIRDRLKILQIPITKQQKKSRGRSKEELIKIVLNKGFTFKNIDDFTDINKEIIFICHCGREFLKATRWIVQYSSSCGCLNSGEKHPKWTGKGDISGSQFSNIVAGAKKRNIPLEITVVDIWEKYESQNRKCALTNVPLQWKGWKKHTGNASVDRIDSTKGYTKDNIQIIHKYLQAMKMEYSQDFFIFMSKLVAQNEFDCNKFYTWEENSFSDILPELVRSLDYTTIVQN